MKDRFAGSTIAYFSASVTALLVLLATMYYGLDPRHALSSLVFCYGVLAAYYGWRHGRD